MKNQNALGLLYMLFASIFFSLMNASIKVLSLELSITQCLFFRSIVMVLLMLAFLGIKPLQKTHTQGGYKQLFLRSVFGATSMLLFFYNVSTIPLGTASTLAQTMPLYAIFLAYFFLKESLHPLVFLASLVGFLGIVLMNNPSANIPLPNLFIGIASGVSAAVALISVRACRVYFDERVIILTFGLVAMIMSLFCMILYPSFKLDILAWKPISAHLWLWILGMGVTGVLGQTFMTKAFILAPAGLISPLDYSKIVFSLILGILLGDAIPNLTSLIGMGLVIFSGILIALPVLLESLKTRYGRAEGGLHD